MTDTQSRSNAIVAMYRAGKTLAECGAAYNITRERARQILAKHGVTGKDGGHSVKARARSSVKAAERAARAEARLKRYIPALLCTAEEAQAICGTRKLWAPRHPLIEAYWSSRRLRIHQGHEWKLTFIEFARVWIDSGKLEMRGRSGADSCVMSRIDKTKPFEAGNVYIRTFGEALRSRSTSRNHGQQATPAI